ncbi:hypothetical protein [Paraburkholderia gardini]|uniref:Aspartyl protease n=1 Tax=Paraburkholderia gardini TaxID=2823469 RepID=A0ABM8U9U0_9BURK|nr:hypothetical protein [Paraburkholderia gardini]CAG4920449.1 hypothetical protein R54767_04717 [Paraburkholderia gardini]
MPKSFLRGRLAVVLLSTSVLSCALSSCSTPIVTPTPPPPAASLLNGGRDGVVIALNVERSDRGQSRLGLPIQIDGKAVYMMLDTGTQGVRVLSSVLPRKDYPAVGGRTSMVFANDAQVSGPLVKLPVGFVGARPFDVTAQSVDDVRCQPGAKRCVAMDGYTGEFGWAFSGLFGVGAEQPDDTCCTQPLRALPGNIGLRYIVHANLARPYLLLTPSKALSSEFTMFPMRTGSDGVRKWPAGCVQVADKMSFCAPVVFSTGGMDMIRIETDTTPNWLDDDSEGKVLKQGNHLTHHPAFFSILKPL